MSTPRSPFAAIRTAALLVLISFWTIPAGVAAIEPDFLMDSDPPLEVPAPVKDFNPALKPLWIEALARPEADMQRMAAETIARAHQQGFPDLVAAVPALEQILQTESSHPAARFAAARALIALDSRGSADKLFDASQKYGADLRQLIEPALATWNHAPAKTVWSSRLEASETRRRDLILAIRGLATVREASALPRLLSFASDLTNAPDLRLESADAAGQIADTGLEQSAERLAQDTRAPWFTNQLCAVRLLARHDSEPARKILLGLASHTEPAVAAASLSRLNEIDSNLVLPLASSALNSRDPRVRLQVVAAFAKLPSVERIQPLGQLLADPHPEVRRTVCDNLLRLAQQPEFRDPVCDVAMSVLDGDMRQHEAALLLGALNHKPAAGRLVELLESPRSEVAVAAAWALRKLALPETIPALMAAAARQTERRNQGEVPGLDEQVAHLFEALGTLKAAEAEPLLQPYYSKKYYQADRSRAAAFWAIGQLKAGVRDSELENTLSGRLMDVADQQPEKALIKQMCAITLARMGAADEATTLNSLVSRSDRPIRLSLALRWALKELTGEELPPPEPEHLPTENWFLSPLP